MIFQPLFLLLIIRHYLFDLCPKFFRMIHLYQMTKFMDNNIIHNFIRCKHKQTVKVQILFCTAASPPRLLIPNCNTTVAYIHYSRKIFYLHRNDLQSQICQLLNLLYRKFLNVSHFPLSIFRFFQMLYDPIFLFFYLISMEIDLRLLLITLILFFIS